ncbi:YfbK domain-containing protein [Mucilaginibacter myungsuensis]|uniref:von Willebrand factor type A domain-containing protein n=1 Tax=Mucilaginibacter myungsuensis TaxID=649104 RepID=A0A929PVH2_9SPHI|nr:von Willebrand factor type A domain-containing protein [Mucilaginibacter myungsuensis]MBE9661129.1 von Willebrand factor type A domain-containing protein [Mucilaginibacter myungsuensis]MDN3597274.1 von Willebrand factor type A domain-containing protein [Mucilaginibacter myungsuensis]
MKKILLLLMTILASVASFGQSTGNKKPAEQYTLTGTVTDAIAKFPLPGATVSLHGRAITATNMDGKYSIMVKPGDTLSFMSLGYAQRFYKLKPGQKILDVTLMEGNNAALKDVVIRGYVRRTREQTTGASTIITAPEVSNNKVANVEQLLQGKVAGLNIQNANSAKAAPVNYGNADRNTLTPLPDRRETNEAYGKVTDNKFLQPTDQPLSTFSVDVDKASYTNIRRYINAGQLPPKDAVRIEEMINYFKYQLPEPKGNEPVAIATALAAAPWAPTHRLLRIGLKAREIPTDKLPASNLVFLIDVSGSMEDSNKLPLVKESMKMLVEQLREQDRVAIVVYAGSAGLVLPSTPGDQKQTIIDALDKLSAGGSTAGGAGIKLAYKVARDNFKKGGNNRVVMATDGDFNVGASSDKSMEELITIERASGVALSVLGYGMGNYKDKKMEILADKGDGNYAYIDNMDEARRALVSEFGGTMFTVAKDVKLQIEFNPAKVQAYRLIGYENRLLAKEDFNNDKKDAGDMGSGHTVTALYEIIPAGIKDDYAGSVDPLKYQKVEEKAPAKSTSDEMLTIKFRYKQPESLSSKLQQVTVNDDPKDFDKQSADFRFAAAVAEVGMLLRDSEFKGQATYDQAIKIAEKAKANDEEGYRSEFIRMVKTARSLSKSELAQK